MSPSAPLMPFFWSRITLRIWLPRLQSGPVPLSLSFISLTLLNSLKQLNPWSLWQSPQNSFIEGSSSDHCQHIREEPWYAFLSEMILSPQANPQKEQEEDKKVAERGRTVLHQDYRQTEFLNRSSPEPLPQCQVPRCPQTLPHLQELLR